MKMKKFLFILLFLFFVCGVPLASDEIPAPFAKAKQMVLKIQPDSLGRHILTFEAQDISFYIIGYLSKQEIIGIGKQMGGIIYVAEYHEKDGKFTIYAYGRGRAEVEAKTAIDLAFEIFRELVAKNLI